MTVQGATFNMHGQLYCGHTNAMALFSSPVVSALGSELDNLGSSPGWGKVLCLWDVQGKKMQAPLLGLDKSIYYHNMLLDQPLKLRPWNPYSSWLFFSFKSIWNHVYLETT